MKKFDRVKIKGTEVIGTIIDLENGQAMVALDRGGLEVYPTDQLEVINSL